MYNFTNFLRSDQAVFMAEIVDKLSHAGLNPIAKTNYIKHQCPSCKKPDAYTYLGAGYFSAMACSHKNHCGWRTTIREFFNIVQAAPQLEQNAEQIQAAFAKHGLDLGLLQKSGLVGENDANLQLAQKDGQTYCKRLRWDQKAGKLRYYHDKGFNAEMGEFYPVLYGPIDEIKDTLFDQLYVFEGDWDWLKGVQDGLACTSSLFGCAYIPKHDDGWSVFVPFTQIRICYDMDTAGQRAAGKLALMVKAKFPDKQVELVQLALQEDQGKDFCDYRMHHPLEEFLKLELTPVDPQATVSHQIVEKDNRTFKVTYVQGAPKLTEICNFVMRIRQQIHDDELKTSWLATLSNEYGQEQIELLGSELNLANEFRKKIATKGIYLLHLIDNPVYNAFVEHVRQMSEVALLRKTQYLGHITPGQFLFNDTIVTKTAITPIAQSNLLPPKGRMVCASRGDLSDVVCRFSELYHEQLWKIIGFAVGSLFAEQIAGHFGFFPLLFLNGSRGSGKSTLAELITALFGAHREIRPFPFNSTGKSIHRAGAKYKGIPVTLNEVQAGHANGNTLLCSLYDREGYQRARCDNSLDNLKSEINATYILLSTQNIGGFEADAVISRLVEVNLDKCARDKKQIEEIRAVKDSLSYFVVHCIQKIDAGNLLAQIDADVHECGQYVHTHERILENHSILRSCANVFYNTVSGSIFDKFAVNVDDIKNDMLKQQQAMETADIAKTFLTMLETMVLKNETTAEIAQFENDGTLIFHLRTVLPLVKRYYRQPALDVVDEKTMGKHLRNLGATSKDSRKLGGKNKKVWFYKRNEQAQEVDLSEIESVDVDAEINEPKPVAVEVKATVASPNPVLPKDN